MDAFFFDSSAVIKRYVNEVGSTFVEKLTDVNSGNLILLARTTRVEVAGAIARRLKDGSITAVDEQDILAAFTHDLANAYFTIEITSTMLSVAMNLCTSHALRGYAAVQLAAAMEANWERVLRGLPPLILVSADKELNQAARDEGLRAEDPDTHL